jgi:hypothetical protein
MGLLAVRSTTAAGVLPARIDTFPSAYQYSKYG